MILRFRNLLILLLILLVTPAYASLIFVNTVEDELNSDGDCSLREAIASANGNSAVDDCTAGQSVQTDAIFFAINDDIVLNPGLGPLIITDRVNLVGSGRETTVIRQESTIQLFLVEMADPTHDVEFSQMTLRDGHAVPGLYGGAVRLMEGDRFEFHDVAFINNTTVGATTESWAGGGAIFAGPLTSSTGTTLQIEDCLFQGNSTVREFGTGARGYGGAIHSLWRAEASTVVNEPLGELIIINSEFRENYSELSGPAVYTRFVPLVTVDGSQFIANETDLVSIGLETGALTVVGSGTEVLLISNSSFIDNLSVDGGSAVHASNLTAAITNSTFTGNKAAPVRAYLGTTLTLQYSTLVNNNHMQVFRPVLDVCDDCDVSLRSSIIWNDWPTDNVCQIAAGGTYTSLGYNIDSDGSCTGHATDLPTTDPQLLPLDSWGGTATGFELLTFLPVPGGPAVDGASLNTCPGPLGGLVSDDARGELRPVDGSETGSNLCDIGAVEYQFEQDPPIETLNLDFAGNGSGRVTSNPPGVDCSDDCETFFPSQTNVRLTATPDAGATFTGWSGACTGTGLCQVVMSLSKQVTATFSQSGPEEIFASGFED